MLRAIAVHPHLHVAPVDRVHLDHEARRKRRFVATGENGLSVLIDLAEAGLLPDGGALRLEDGREVEIRAADEELARITAPDQAALIRIAWHLGNRHLPTQLLDGALVIRRDHVIEEMVRLQGGAVVHIAAPFEPEGGAYGGHGHGHHHHHGDDHGHGHSHG